MKLMNSIIILLILVLLCAPSSSHGSTRLKEDFFVGKLYLSNSPQVGQKANITLDLTAVSGDCGATTIVFRMPDGILISGQSVFREMSFVKGLSRQYSTEIDVLKEGVYSLQASVYFELNNRREAEHFFLYLIVGKTGSRITDNINYLTKSENGIDTRIINLAPPESARAMGALSIQGQVTYYDDNLTRPIPIKRVMIQLFEVNQNGSDLLGTTYTNIDGFYVFDGTNAPKLGDGNTRDLQPKLVFDNDVIKIINDANNEIYTFDMPLIRNASVGSIVSDYFLNESNQQRAIGHIFNNAVTAYDFLQEKVNWKRNKLSLTWPYQSEGASYGYVFSTSTGKLISETIYIPIKKQWDRTSFFHEYGHSAMMALYGYNVRNFPSSNYEGSHSVNTVSDSDFAMSEGWAGFFEALVDDNAFNYIQYSNANKPNIEYNSWWKGKDGNNTNGEIVEGAVASIFWDIIDTAQSIDEVPNVDDDNINGMIVELWDLMAKNRPLSITKLWDHWQNNNYGQVESLYTIFTNNGIKVNIKPPNRPPIADSKTVETNEDTSLSIKLTGSDPDNDPLIYVIVEQPKNGTLAGNVPDLIYTPKSEFYGTDSFTFLVNDGFVNSVPATVSINIISVNDPPVAKSQTVNTPEDTPITITLIGTDIDSNNLIYKVTSNPAKGILVGNAPALIYTPNLDFYGDDSFNFTVSDGFIASNTATVKITVQPINDPPIVKAISVVTEEDIPVKIMLTGSDPESDYLTFRITQQPSHGTLEGTPPELIYNPQLNFNGNDRFIFVASDGKADSGTETVSIKVNPVNDPPTADILTIDTDENVPVKIKLLGSDLDGDNITFKIIDQTVNGKLNGTLPDLTYEPEYGFIGEDSFTFVVDDGVIASVPVKVDIKVKSTGDPLDVNKDGIINILDIVIISKFFGKSDFPIDYNPDVNRDGNIDNRDFELVIINFGKKSER
jgi:hypothetical protein